MKKIFTFAAALLFGMSMMATEYEWTRVPGMNFWSEDNAVVVRSALNLSYEQKQMASDDNTNKLWGIKVGSSANTNMDTAYIQIDCGAEITELELGVSNCSTNAGVKYAIVFCQDNQFTSVDQTVLTPVVATSINRSVTSDNHQTITVPEGAQSLRIYRKVRVNGTDYGAGTSVDLYYLRVVVGQAVTKYTVTYMDGETVLGTEKVKEGETATKAQTYEAKTHATFNGWFNEANFQTPADFTAAINADKTFYGKWTADAFTASSSINIEQLVLDNGKSYDIAGALSAANITYANINDLDSLNDAKDYRNEPYLGLKLKTAGAYVEIGLNANDVLKVKFGNVAADIKVNGVTVAKADLAEPYVYTATEQGYVRIETTTEKTVVLKQIMINEDIKQVELPESPVTGMINTTVTKANKVIENGQIVIIKNGVRYNAVGAEL